MSLPDVFLYLTTTGRTSGEPRRIEIWFVELGGRYYLVSEKGAASHWVQNLRKEPRVRFSVGTRTSPALRRAETAAQARTLDGDEDTELAAAVREAMDAKYGWSEGLVVELAPSRVAG